MKKIGLVILGIGVLLIGIISFSKEEKKYKEYIKWILKQIFLYIRQFNYQKFFKVS